MSDPSTCVYVIYEATEDEQLVLIEAHVSAESAEAAMKHIHVSGILQVEAVELKSVIDYDAEKEKKKATRAKKKSEKATKKAEKSDDDDEVANSITESRKTFPDIPDARPGILKGLKLLFTGTMNKDRTILKATAAVYGAQVTSSVKAADYVVLGTKAGPKKLQEIQDLNTATVSEEGFYDMLRFGPPVKKRERDSSPGEESDQSAVDDSEAEEDMEPVMKKQKISS